MLAMPIAGEVVTFRPNGSVFCGFVITTSPRRAEWHVRW